MRFYGLAIICLALLPFSGCRSNAPPAGVVRTGDILLLWDWVNGKVFAYDGFQMVELTDLPQ